MKFGAPEVCNGLPLRLRIETWSKIPPAASVTPSTLRTFVSSASGNGGGEVWSEFEMFSCGVTSTATPSSPCLKICSNDLLIVSVRT
jgi:hypothetical protein